MDGATVLAAACPKERSVKVLDLATGTVYFTFADTAVPLAGNGMATVAGAGSAEGLASAGDYLVTSQANEHALVFHRWGKTQPLFKCRTPEQVGPVAATPDGLYVLAGGKSGKVYAWETATGSLVRAWDAHFKAVTCLALTADGGVLLTGSEDTLVKAWPVAEVVVDDGNGGAEDPAAGGGSTGLRPLRSWAEHSLPVTALFCGQGGPAARIVSCSLDHTARIYELGADASVCAVRCPSGLASVAMDAGDRRLALGGALGDVYLVDLDVVAMARTAARAAIQAVGASGGGGSGGTLLAGAGVGAVEEGDRMGALVGHSKAVTALGWSWDGRLVISTSEDGSARMWDADGRQCVRRVSFDTPGPIAHLLVLPRPAALLEMLPKATMPAPLQPLKKYRSAIAAPAGGGGSGGGGGVGAVTATAAAMGGDLAFVLGAGGGGRRGGSGGTSDDAALFWGAWHGTTSGGLPSQPSASNEANGPPEPAAGPASAGEEQGGQDSTEAPSPPAAKPTASKKGGGKQQQQEEGEKKGTKRGAGAGAAGDGGSGSGGAGGGGKAQKRRK